MSTKNLSRTIIEGGRYSGNKYQRRMSNRQVRSRSRAFVRDAMMLLDPDDLGAAPARVPVRKEFSDKVRPVMRWMESHAGQSWDDVHSKIRRKFDTRTIAGQHVVFDHMIGGVRMLHEHCLYPTWGGLTVGSDGILRHEQRKRYRSPRRDWRKWAGVRKVADYGGESVFWMNPVRTEWVECKSRRIFRDEGCRGVHRKGVKSVLVNPGQVLACDMARIQHELYRNWDGEWPYLYRDVPVTECLRAVERKSGWSRKGGVTYLQGERLTPEELAFWNSLSDTTREALLA